MAFTAIHFVLESVLSNNEKRGLTTRRAGNSESLFKASSLSLERRISKTCLFN